jgi:hypothetical protein
MSDIEIVNELSTKGQAEVSTCDVMDAQEWSQLRTLSCS